MSRSAPPPPHLFYRGSMYTCKKEIKHLLQFDHSSIQAEMHIYHKYLDVLTEQFSFIVSICFNVKFLFNFEIQEIDRTTEVLTCTEASEKVTCKPYNARKDHVSIWRVFLLCASIYFIVDCYVDCFEFYSTIHLYIFSINDLKCRICPKPPRTKNL